MIGHQVNPDGEIFQNGFWTGFLKDEDEEFRHIPKYIIHCLSALGYDSPISFGSVTEADFDEILSGIDRKMNSLDEAYFYDSDINNGSYTDSDLNDELKMDIFENVIRLWQKIGVFNFPPGHKNVAKAVIRRICERCSEAGAGSTSKYRRVIGLKKHWDGKMSRQTTKLFSDGEMRYFNIKVRINHCIIA